jgi:excisionase family DNA binding protein
MLTVPEVARRVGRNPETVRRWIREGKLPARKIGTQHVIDEDDLALVGAAPPRHRTSEAVSSYGSNAPAPVPVAEPANPWLPAIVGRIVRLVDPARIILFGSRALGTARTDSDYDLLVILDSVEDRRATGIAIRRTLDDLPISKDVVVATSEEASWAPSMVGDILRAAVATGHIIYERAKPE